MTEIQHWPTGVQIKIKLSVEVKAEKTQDMHSYYAKLRLWENLGVRYSWKVKRVRLKRYKCIDSRRHSLLVYIGKTKIRNSVLA